MEGLRSLLACSYAYAKPMIFFSSYGLPKNVMVIRKPCDPKPHRNDGVDVFARIALLIELVGQLVQIVVNGCDAGVSVVGAVGTGFSGWMDSTAASAQR